MGKRRAMVVDDYDGARRVHLVGGSPVPAEPAPVPARAQDPQHLAWDPRAQTHVAYVQRDAGPASAQDYRPVVEVEVADDAGRRTTLQRRATGIEYLYRAGDITDSQIEAVRWLADTIERAQLGAAIQAVDWGRPGAGAFDPAKAFGPTGYDSSTAARRRVREALDALGWPDSLPARILVYTIQTGSGVLGWQAQAEGDPAKRKHRQYLVGCLVGAIVQLDIWYRSRA